MTFTAMSYNIRSGGGGRLAAIAEVIRAAGPDLVVVQELGRSAGGSTGPAGNTALRRLADALGMRGFAAHPGWPAGQPVGALVHPAVRVLAAGPLRGPFHHGAIRLVIDADVAVTGTALAGTAAAGNGGGGGRGPLTVLGAHLCPYSGTRRLWEARRLGRVADPARPVLLLGDLNSLDPWTDHCATLARLPERYRARHLRRRRPRPSIPGPSPRWSGPA